MNGFKLMADSYRTLVEQGKISQEDAEKEISTYEFLAACKQEDLYRMVDTGAFNDIMKAYMRKALRDVDVDNKTESKVMEELRWLLDTRQAREICE